MKKRPVIKAILMMSMATTLLSCKEEEFYEKEYIQTYQEEYEESIVEDMDPSINSSVDDGSTTGDDGSTTGDDGSTTGDDGSTTGDDGSTTGDDGSTTGDDGSTTGDDGSTTGDDGSTTGDDGSTTGDDGSTTGDDGSTTGDDGSTTGDDGSTTGDDGSTTGDDGSTTGDDGSTTGDDGSTTGDDGSADPVIIENSDSFTQQAGSNKLDILWVIDNSGSMREEQQQLAYNFDIFINKFIEKDIDFKMSITTTETRGNNAGKPVQDSLEKLTSEKLAENKEQFLQDFSDMVQVGTNGYGIERGIWSSEVFSNRFANRHFREDAYFVIVYVSDEEDQSNKSPEAHLKQIAKWKNNAGLVKTYGIVNMSAPYNPTRYLVPGYERFKAMSDLTNGYITDINDSFYNTLLKMGNEIAELSESFPLSQNPYDALSVKVYVDGQEILNGWEYNEDNNTIKFYPDSVPAPNATIEVKYEVES